MQAKMREVTTEMRRRMHHPIPEQGAWLASVLTGHYRYYAVPDNGKALEAFRERVIWHWLRMLRRRSQRSRMTRERMRRLAARWLPRPASFTPGPTRALTPAPKGGAQCVRRARWDLCGGRSATAVPTATRYGPRGGRGDL